jgi:hypothetical protein
VSDKDKDKDKERQWDREMAQVDKLLAKLPTYESTRPSGRPPLGGAELGDPTVRRSAAGEALRRGGTAAAMWGRVALGVVLAIGVTTWPYSHVCGLKLMFYLTGVTMLLVAGVWSALATWKRRAGAAHVLSLLVVGWGLGLAAQAILPRTGYAAERAIFFCPEPTAPPAQD